MNYGKSQWQVNRAVQLAKLGKRVLLIVRDELSTRRYIRQQYGKKPANLKIKEI